MTRCNHVVSFFVFLISSVCSARSGTFPDAHNLPPAGWTGHVFRLSQDYPTTPPPAELFPWKSIDFKAQPLEYIESVLKHSFEGNLSVNWEGDKNPVRRWDHAPCMHATPPGRETIRG